jgi:hypothetical protein
MTVSKIDLSNPPELYWHCVVKIGEKSRHAVINDLSFDQLIRNIVDPWKSGRQFSVSGTLVKQGNITEIKISHTPNPAEVYAQTHYQKMARSGITDLATDPRLIPLGVGTDLTNELLFSDEVLSAPSADTALILEICRRIRNSARILSNRPRKGKTPFLIEDEYDVQDLLQAVLKAYLKYSVQEDPLPKVAAAKSSRADISIEDLGILIEVKYVRESGDQKRIFEEYSEDLELYSKCSYLKTFIFLIYNASVLRDPEGFEKLSGPQERNGKRFDVRIVLS